MLFAIPTYGFVVSILIMIAHRARAVRRRVPGDRGGRADPRRGDRRRRDRAVRDPARVLLGSDGAHRRRGDLERRPGVPPAAGAQRRRDARDHGRDRDHDVPRDLVARDPHPGHGGERRPLDPGADRARGVRRRVRLLRRAVLHGGDPDPRGEHRVSGLPPALVDPRARPVHAEAVHEPRGPPGVLERRPRARGRRRR